MVSILVLAYLWQSIKLIYGQFSFNPYPHLYFTVVRYISKGIRGTFTYFLCRGQQISNHTALNLKRQNYTIMFFFSLTCRYEFFDAKKNYNDLRQYWPLVVWFYSIFKNTKLFFIISYQSYTQGINWLICTFKFGYTSLVLIAEFGNQTLLDI